MLLRCRRRSIISRFPKCWAMHFSNFEHRTSGIYHREDLSKKESYKPLVLPCLSVRLSGTRTGSAANINGIRMKFVFLSFCSFIFSAKDTKSHLKVIYYVFEINEISRVSNEFRTGYPTGNQFAEFPLFCWKCFFFFLQLTIIVKLFSMLSIRKLKINVWLETVALSMWQGFWAIKV